MNGGDSCRPAAVKRGAARGATSVVARDARDARSATGRRWLAVAAVTAALASLAAAPARAQYTADGPEDLMQGEGVRYFGSARDERGALLADVSFLFEAGESSFVFVTDATGHYRGMLPLSVANRTVAARCWRGGLETVRVERRAAPKAARAAMQVDCVLRRKAAAN